MFNDIPTSQPRNYPHNMWDIGYTIRSDVPAVRLTEPWRIPFEVENYVLHSLLDNRPSPQFQSRGYCYVDAGQSMAHRRILRDNTGLPRLSIRQSLTASPIEPLYHFLRGSNNLDHKRVPASGRSYYTRLSNFTAVVKQMRSNQLAVSALRHDCAVRVSIVRNRNFSEKRLYICCQCKFC